MSNDNADHRHLRPKAIHDPEIPEEFSKDYMYLQCIQFINSVSLHMRQMIRAKTQIRHDADQDRVSPLAFSNAG